MRSSAVHVRYIEVEKNGNVTQKLTRTAQDEEERALSNFKSFYKRRENTPENYLRELLFTSTATLTCLFEKKATLPFGFCTDSVNAEVKLRKVMTTCCRVQNEEVRTSVWDQKTDS